VYEVPSGRLVRRFALRDTVTPRMLNDVAFSPAGDAYLTDSHGGSVYRVRAGADSLERFLDGGSRLVYPNGVAVSPDGAALYVAHVEGLSRVDLRARGGAPVAEPVTSSAPHFAGMIDGLYACGRDLIAVQSVVDHQRVVRLRLDPAGTRLTAAEVLERRHPAYELPTTGVLVDGSLVYVANSQLRRLRDDGTLAPAAAPRGTVLLRLPLGGPCR
jgi:sugar lactone lactonase YvrE